MSELKSEIAALFAQNAQATQEPQLESNPAPQPITPPQNTEGVHVENTPPPQPTEVLYGGISETALLTALKERTGGKIQDFAQFEQLDELPTLRQRATELEDKAKISPFANPVVEKLNQLYNAGADQKTVSMFLEAQTLNIDSLSDKEKYAEYLVRSIPNITKATAQQYYEEKFGDEDLTPTQQIEKAREILQATNYLKEQKVTAENPEAIRKQSEQAELFERNRSTWQQQVREISNQVKSVNGSYKKAEGEFSFGVNISPQEIEQLLPFVLKTVEQMPLNHESANTAKSLIEGYWLMANKDKAFETVHRDGFEKGYELATKANAGAAPTTTNEVAPNAVQSEFDKFRQANPRLSKIMDS